jgi:ubiquinol-cytochrome c reductase iron-sulfur subunit
MSMLRAVRQPVQSHVRYGGSGSLARRINFANSKGVEGGSGPHGSWWRGPEPPPTSEVSRYRNQFVQKANPAEFEADMKNAVKPPVVTDPYQLCDADSGDPHNTEGTNFFMYSYKHYDYIGEPTDPRKPDLAQGELAVGATVVRTDVWAHPTEPAITSVARFEPSNFRPVGYAEHAPNPESTVPEGHLDFRHLRLNPGHADRRPFVYFLSCSSGFVFTSLIRAAVCKAIYTWWPAKDVFAAGVVEVDLRPIDEGQNFIVKWRGKPVFVRKRTQEWIAAARKDDAVAASMREPAKDTDRTLRPEWLIMIGVCTHLGCIPYPDQGLYSNGGYFCPCHGSHYDESGRIRQGPAAGNLPVPEYAFLDDDTVRIG